VGATSLTVGQSLLDVDIAPNAVELLRKPIDGPTPFPSNEHDNVSGVENREKVYHTGDRTTP
jgi:hypothetical protein